MNTNLRKNKLKKKKFTKCPSSKRRLNLIKLKRTFGNPSRSTKETISKGKKLESKIIKKKAKKKKKRN